ncbi:Transposase [Streptomyces sp. MnatMP-M27]|uniref:IS3 family transposase n=1 Tax=Streptomyces sp. MnatMP-M27 TaxID=1839768 RepID=UPI00081DD47E|nr:Transposase [Streptomyces sp. MnatMP-M27]
MKNYPPQFKADAVARYQSRPGATIRQVAAHLGINPETLRNWVRIYYWRRTAADRAARQATDARLATRIRAVHPESGGTYGVPRNIAELHDDGERVNHKRIARVMRSIGLAGVRLRRHLLHALHEFEQFYNGHRPHRPHQGIANAGPLHPSPRRSAPRTHRPAST